MPSVLLSLVAKAWLFSDIPAGARVSATHYSLIETAKANGQEPYEYIKQVLTALPYAESVEDIEALLPWNIKKIRVSKIGQVRLSISGYKMSL